MAVHMAFAQTEQKNEKQLSWTVHNIHFVTDRPRIQH
jgi:hypothetical protein